MKKYDKQEMYRLYQLWLETGRHNKKGFCREHGLIESSFHYYIRKFEDGGKPSPPKAEPVGFRQLDAGSMPAGPGSSPSARINYPSGVCIELFGSLNLEVLKSLTQ